MDFLGRRLRMSDPVDDALERNVIVVAVACAMQRQPKPSLLDQTRWDTIVSLVAANTGCSVADVVMNVRGATLVPRDAAARDDDFHALMKRLEAVPMHQRELPSSLQSVVLVSAWAAKRGFDKPDGAHDVMWKTMCAMVKTYSGTSVADYFLGTIDASGLVPLRPDGDEEDTLALRRRATQMCNRAAMPRDWSRLDE